MRALIILMALITLSPLSHAYDFNGPEAYCCIKKTHKEIEEASRSDKEDLRREREHMDTVEIDPEDLQSIKNCALLRSITNRNNCARRYINPWEFNHIAPLSKEF